MRLYKEVDIAATYANVITSTYLDGAAIPIIMNTDRDAIALAVKSCVRIKPENVRLVRIANTLRVTDIQVSESLLPFVKANPALFEITGEPAAIKFDASGRIVPLPGGH